MTTELKKRLYQILVSLCLLISLISIFFLHRSLDEKVVKNTLLESKIDSLEKVNNNIKEFSSIQIELYKQKTNEKQKTDSLLTKLSNIDSLPTSFQYNLSVVSDYFKTKRK